MSNQRVSAGAADIANPAEMKVMLKRLEAFTLPLQSMTFLLICL